jgi:transcriptional regulator GlxA family with amidase domain
MSAIIEEDGSHEPLKVLITMHEGMNAMDVVGPLEVFSSAQHDPKNTGQSRQSVLRIPYSLLTLLISESKAFRVAFAAATEQVVTMEGASLRAHITYEEAMKRLADIDVLVIPGGGTDKILKTKEQPFTIIKAFTELQKRNPSRERTLMSVCTGSLFLAELGILSGLAATTHPDYITKMEIIW